MKITMEAAIGEARRARARRELGGLDYLRAVRAAVEVSESGVVARALGVSLERINEVLSEAVARGVGPVPDGFSGAGPYEIAQRYAAGFIDRAEMIRQLSAWPYVANDGAIAAAVEWDSTPYVDPPGTFEEVGRAFDEGLIDGDAYEQILNDSEDVPGT